MIQVQEFNFKKKDMEGLRDLEKLKINKNMSGKQVFNVVAGTAIFAISMYALYLSIKSNRLTIRKYEDEGYK